MKIALGVVVLVEMKHCCLPFGGFARLSRNAGEVLVMPCLKVSIVMAKRKQWTRKLQMSSRYFVQKAIAIGAVRQR